MKKKKKNKVSENEMKYRKPSQFSRIIVETKELILEHEHETTYLVRKSDEKILMNEDFYGDPMCGIIDTENKWAIVAGEHLTLWTLKSKIKYQTKDFKNIHSIRTKDNKTIEILIDPWDENSAIWELNLQTKNLIKIVDFNKYQGKEYVAKIEW